MADYEHGIRTYMVYGMSGDHNTSAFQQYLMDSMDILSYWNHLPLLYFLKTRENAERLTAKFRPFYPNAQFIVVEVNPGNANGILPEVAWKWFWTDAPTEKRATAGPSLLSLIFPGASNT